MATTVDVQDLRVEVVKTGAEIVDGLSFAIAEGEVVGLVGESGSGKTTAALALLGDAKRGTRLAAGSVRIADIDLIKADSRTLRDLRGRVVAYVPQDPAAALDPSLRLGHQLSEVLDSHNIELASSERRERVRQSLRDARLPADDEFARRYPHQLSGGQQQRACIAMAFMLEPRLIVLDEPTTGLDVTTQSHILELIRDLCRRTGTAALYVSHDLAAVGSLAERVMVMYAGRLVETGPTGEIFELPGHPYTRKLIGAIPDVESPRVLQSIPGTVPAPGERGTGCVFAPRCPVVIDRCHQEAPAVHEFAHDHRVLCFRANELGRPVLEIVHPEASSASDPQAQLSIRDVSASHGDRQVLRQVSFDIRRGECVALVGESGSGKTTLSRAIVGLHTAWSGEIYLGGDRLAARARDRTDAQRRKAQYVFQSPYNSLNPRRTIADIIKAPLEHFLGLRGSAATQRAQDTLERVALTSTALWRYPDELSGGERQRVAIARALAAEPEILVCDEVTSALDASVQAAIVQLLEDLRTQEGLAILFVTHNIALVRTVAHRVVVLENGQLVEKGASDDVLRTPSHPYTQRLIQDTPSLSSVSEQASHAESTPPLLSEASRAAHDH